MKKLFLLMFFSLMIISLIGVAAASTPVRTYSDSARTISADDFALGDTVYGQITTEGAGGVLTRSRFVWKNQLGYEVRTSDCISSPSTGPFNDEYTTLTDTTDSIGTWHVERRLYSSSTTCTGDPSSTVSTTFHVYQCIKDSNCNDGNSCTTDTCQANSCAHSNLPEGTECGTSGTCNSSGQCSEPQIPEFSAISAGIALIGAGIGFLALRRKR